MKKPRKRSYPTPGELEELPELEAWDEDGGLVTVTAETAGDGDFDLKLAVEVAEMAKHEVTAAVEASLRRKVEELGSALRWQRVYVEFSGDAMIPGAAKGMVADVLGAAKPLSVTVQRGYPDERVLEAEAPRVELVKSTDGEATRVQVKAGDLEAEDYPFALAPELDGLTAGAAGKAIEISFEGASPNAQTRDHLRTTLAGAGAVRIAFACAGGAPEVVFDRELEARVKIDASGAEVAIDVAPAHDESDTIAALALVLGRVREQIGGRDVTVRFAERSAGAAEVTALLVHAEQMAASRLALAEVGGEPDQLWPPLLAVATEGRMTTVSVTPGARDRSALVRAFRRESARLGEEIGQRFVTVDWPEALQVDAELERACIDEGLVCHDPSSVAYTFGGDAREPVLPRPLRFGVDQHGDATVKTCDLDTDTGRPVELVRALERRLGAATAELNGQRIRVAIVGSGAVSRTLQRTLFERLEAAGVSHAEISDRGSTEIVLPRLLGFEDLGDAVRVSVVPGQRDAAQIESAATRELDARDLSDAAMIHLASSAADDAMLAALIERGASKVMLEGAQAVQIHPTLFAPAERTGDELRLRASVQGDDEAVCRQVERELPRILASQDDLGSAVITLSWPGATNDAPPVARATALIVAAEPAALLLDSGGRKPRKLFPEDVRIPVTVLGRKDSATPPMLLLGIASSDDATEIADTVAALSGMSGEIEGRRLLVTFRDDDHDLALADDDALLQGVRGALDGAAAVLLFRAGRPDTPAHFEVVSSSVDGLAVGARMRDPRG